MVEEMTLAELQDAGNVAAEVAGGVSAATPVPAGASAQNVDSPEALARELTDIILLLNARGSRAPVPSWLVGRLVTYRDHLVRGGPTETEPAS